MAIVVVSDLLDIGEADADAGNVAGIILTSCDGAGEGFFSKIGSFCLIVKEKV